MLKENRNIDESYTDRVVRQLVDETAIDFNGGKVHLPGTDYSWTFNHFGPGGLENALMTTASNSFGTHIINSYGIDEEEFEEVLTKFIEVIAAKINRYLDPIFNLQENKNIDWDYTDRVVKQLVDETEIDFKNRRVRLDAAEYSFPFYSFGSRRAHRENIIFEPNSKFGKHVISNYGVDETEYKEIYAMYMGIIASRLQDHDENINHLHLHESRTYGYLFHEDNFLDKIVEQLLAETKVFNDRGQLRANPPFFQSEWEDVELEGRATGVVGGIPLSELIDSTPNDTIFVDFKYYCKQMYGLTFEECYYVWREYRSGLYQTDFSHLYTPNIHLNESSLTPSYRDSDEVPSTLARIVYQLVNETIIEDDEYGIPVAYPSWIIDEGFGGEGVALDILLDSDKKSVNFTEFHYYVNNMYGLDEDEIDYVWSSYKGWLWEKEQQNVYAYQKSLEDEELNESLSSRVNTEVDDLFDEDKNLSNKKKIKSIFRKKYRMNKQDADDALVLYLSKQQSLNESPDDLDSYIQKGTDKMVGNTPYIHKVVNTMVDNTHLSGEKTTNSIRVKLPFSIEDNIQRQFDEIGQYYITSPTARVVAEIRKHLILIYGMDKWETDQATLMYLSKMTEKINDYKGEGLNESVYHDYKDPLLSSKSHDLIKKVVDQLMDETQLIFSPQPPVQNTMEKNYRGGFVRAPYINKGWWGDQQDHLVGMSQFMHGSPELLDRIEKYIKGTYGLSEREGDVALINYNSRIRNKIKHTDPHNKSELTESEDKEENHLDKIVDHLINETNFTYSHIGSYVDPTQFTNKERESLDSYIDAPFLDGSYLSSHILHSARSYHSFVDYSKEVFGLTEDEMEYIWEKYQKNLIEILTNTLNESVDLSYSDDKDFPFLNQLANHTMNITEIGRNAVLFPFIDGYISDGNFHKYFNGTPYDQLPFEATLKLDEYLKDFGLTENEKGIWWDIYLIKVIDAVNERDLKIIDNYGN